MTDIASIDVKHIRGVGPQKVKELQEMGLETVGQLIACFPYRYDDYTIRDLTQVKDGDKITVQGQIVGMPVLQRFGKKSRLSCVVLVDEFMVTAVWFNRPFLKEHLVLQSDILLTGKWDQRRRQLTVSESELSGKGTSKSGTLQPVYHLPGTISQVWFRKTMLAAFKQFGELITEILPPDIIQKYGFMPRKEAISHIHLPGDLDAGLAARKPLVYEELFLFQLKLQAYKAITHKRGDGIAQQLDLPAVRSFVRSLPFELTDSQKKVLADILRDMQAQPAMNRLMQGDVGSGKTVVAAAALFATVKAGYQGALMAPTEILAEQHGISLKTLFEPYGIRTALLTGSVTAKARREMLAALQSGDVEVLIGTHALIQEDVYFRQLGLVVTDEQHRFGVNQRSILRRKGMTPDVLSMTATPIPRTLAITAFGDMDVSTLRELPKGRQPIKTYWVRHEMMERVHGFIEREVEAGRQAYVICPLIEESEKLDVQNAIDVYVQLSQHFTGTGVTVGLLHGRLSASEKEATMRAFKDNAIQVLVSTTVIEVGVDVPNATLMIINDAERFGLSQLHQLRGRVGRGSHQSYCVLIADPKTEVGKERMKVMSETNDGFEIARRDLELRGPGDFFGTKQSGLPEFRLADLLADFEWMELARDDAADLTGQPLFWTHSAYAPLRQYLQREHILDGELLD